MPINLELRTCRLGAGTKKVKNPFGVLSGSEIEVPGDDGLTAEEKHAVKTLLDMIAGPTPPAEYVDWSKSFDDGGIVDVWAVGLDDDSVVSLVSLVVWRRSPFVAELAFQLSEKGNLAIVTEVEGIGPWVTSAEQAAAVKERWAAVELVATSAELAKKISRARDELDMPA